MVKRHRIVDCRDGVATPRHRVRRDVIKHGVGMAVGAKVGRRKCPGSVAGLSRSRRRVLASAGRLLPISFDQRKGRTPRLRDCPDAECDASDRNEQEGKKEQYSYSIVT